MVKKSLELSRTLTLFLLVLLIGCLTLHFVTMITDFASFRYFMFDKGRVDVPLEVEWCFHSPRPANTTCLVGWWRMDEGSGNRTDDSTDGGKDGTIYGASWVDGKFGKALSFDGVDDYVDCGSVLNNIDTHFTIETWLKVNSLPAISGESIFPIVGKFDGTRYWLLSIKRGNSDNIGFLHFRLWDGTVVVSANSPVGSIVTGTWYHVAAVRNGNTFEVYINGERKNTVTQTFGSVANSGVLRIAHNLENWAFFNGIIDELRIYNCSLSADQIYKDYNKKGMTVITSSHYWSKNDAKIIYTFDFGYSFPSNASGCWMKCTFPKEWKIINITSVKTGSIVPLDKYDIGLSNATHNYIKIEDSAIRIYGDIFKVYAYEVYKPVSLILLDIFLTTVRSTFLFLLFALIPINIGVLFTKFLMKQRISIGIINMVCYWTIGSLVMFFAFILISNIIFHYWNFYVFSLLSFILVFIFCVFQTTKAFQCLHNFPFKNLKFSLANAQEVMFLIILIIIGIFSAIFPHIEHLHTSMEIFLTRNYINSWTLTHSIKFLENAPFNYFGGDIPFIPLFTAVISSISGINPLYLYFYLGFGASFIYSFMIYIIARYLTYNKRVSLLTAIVATWAYVSNVLDDSFSHLTLQFMMYPLVIAFMTTWGENHSDISNIARPILQISAIWIMLALAVMFSGIESLTITRHILLLCVILTSICLTTLNRDWIYVIITVFLLINPLTCSILLLPIILALLLSSIVKKIRKIRFLIFSLITFILLYATYYGLIKFKNPNYLSAVLSFAAPAGPWTQTPQEKVQHLFDYGPNLLVNVGLVGSLVIGLESKRKDRLYILTLILFLSLLILIFPEGETTRLSFGLAFPLALFASLFIDKIASMFRRVEIKIKIRFAQRRILASTVIFLILATSFSLYVIQNSQRFSWHNALINKNIEGIHSFYTTYEIKVAEWIYLNTPLDYVFYPFFENINNEALINKIALKSPVLNREITCILSKANDTLIVSDPFTMASLNALTLRSCLMPERAFIYEEEYSNYTLLFLEKLKACFRHDTASAFMEDILKLKDEIYGNATKKIIYVVISQRTLIWLNSNMTFVKNIDKSYDFKPILHIFFDSKWFEPVFSIPGKVYIFKCKSSPN